MHEFPQYPCDVGSQQRDRDLGETVLSHVQCPPRDHTHPNSDCHAHDSGEDELEERLIKHEGPAHGRANGSPVQHQRCGIIDETLALEDCDDAARDAQPLPNGRRRYGIRRRNNGA